MSELKRDAQVRADLQLAEIVEAVEETDWSEVPGISSLEAATWTKRLLEARDEISAAGLEVADD